MTNSNKSKQKEFDLEKAIITWKKSLRCLNAAKDGDLVELEGYLRDKIDELSGEGLSEQEAFQKATSEFTDLDGLDSDYFRARSASSLKSRPPWKPPRCIPALLWNYFKIVGRKLKRQIESSYPDILSWAKPSLAVLKGTKLGSIPDGPLKLEDFYDAILWLGSISTISYSGLVYETVEDESYYT